MRDEIPRKTSIEKTQGNLLSSAYNIQGRGLWLLPGPSLCPLNSRASENRGPMQRVPDRGYGQRGTSPGLLLLLNPRAQSALAALPPTRRSPRRTGERATPSHKSVKHVLRFNARLREGVPEVELALV